MRPESARKRNIARLSAAVVLLCAAAVGRAESLTYTLHPRPESGRIEVELVWQTGARSGSALCVSPRCGTVTSVPRLLKDIVFDGVSEVRRRESCWILTHPPQATITCRYAVDPRRREFDWDSTHHPITTATFFHGLGNAFLLSPGTSGQQPDEYDVILRWKVPDDWKAVCSWGVGRTVGTRMRSEDVRQAVYLAGPLVRKTVDVPGADRLTVAMLDDFDFDVDEFAELAANLVAGQCAFMAEQAFPPFVVTAVPVGEPVTGGNLRMAGTGLDRSFALWVSPQAALTDGVEHLFAHELFHHWNGRVLPAADPDKLVYWFTEGFTDYYSLRILYESGRWDAKTYAKWLNRHLREYDANPAQNARNDDILAQFWTKRDTVGEVAYQRGLLLALRWHRLARDRGVTDGVDRWFKTLVERARGGGFEVSNDALRDVGVRVLGDWFAAEFDRYVESAVTVAVPTDALAPDFHGHVQPVYEFQLGFDRARSLPKQRVRGLVKSSAAAKAGLKNGDELAGWDLHGDPAREIQLQVRRGGKLRTIRYYPRGTRRDVLQFQPVTTTAKPP